MHLTPRQLATRWQVSEKTLERWRHTGTGPGFFKIASRILYPLTNVEAMESKVSHPSSCDVSIVRESPRRGCGVISHPRTTE